MPEQVGDPVDPEVVQSPRYLMLRRPELMKAKQNNGYKNDGRMIFCLKRLLSLLIVYIFEKM